MPEPEQEPRKKKTFEELLGKAMFDTEPEFLKTTHARFLEFVEHGEFENLADLVEAVHLDNLNTMRMNFAFRDVKPTFSHEQMNRALLYFIQNDRVGAFYKIRVWTFMGMKDITLKSEDVQPSYNRMAVAGNYREIDTISANTKIEPVFTEMGALQESYNAWAREGKTDIIGGIQGVTKIEPAIAAENALEGYNAIVKSLDLHHDRHIRIKSLYEYSHCTPILEQSSIQTVLGYASIANDFGFVRWAMKEFNWEFRAVDEIYIHTMLMNFGRGQNALEKAKELYSITGKKPEKDTFDFIMKYMKEKRLHEYVQFRRMFSKPPEKQKYQTEE